MGTRPTPIGVRLFHAIDHHTDDFRSDITQLVESTSFHEARKVAHVNTGARCTIPSNRHETTTHDLHETIHGLHTTLASRFTTRSILIDPSVEIR